MPKFKLMKHQKKAVKFLDSVDGIGALLMEPGTGKTGASLAWIDKMAKRHGEFRVLVVAPLTAADTWVLQTPMFMSSPTKARFLQGSTVSILTKMAQAKAWADVPEAKVSVDHPGSLKRALDGSKVTILSVSAGSISTFYTSGDASRPKRVQMLKAIRRYAPHLVIVDESHIIKSDTANISKAMYNIGQLVPHRVILTGTVTPNGPLDVYGQWRFLAPWTFSDQYGEEFTKRPLDMSKAEQARVKPWPMGRMKNKYTIPGGYEGKGVKDYINIEEPGGLNDRVTERAMVVRKADVLKDLPPFTDIDVHITLSPKEQKAYNEMRDDLFAELADGSLLEAPNVLAKIMKLRQIASGFVKDTETGDVHIVGKTMQKAAVEIVNTQLAGEKRVVVFAYFKAEVAAMAEALRLKGRTVETITGATKGDERLAIRQRFGDVSGNPEPIVLVAQQRTMSISVNELVTASHAVYTSNSERRNDWVQSRDRLHRHGQKLPVTFWNVYAPDTVGEVMLETYKTKGALEKALLDHIAATRR